MRLLFSLLALVTADASPKICLVCTAGTSYYAVPVHGYPLSTQPEMVAESLRVCRLIVQSWGKNPVECAAKGCAHETCIVDDPGTNPPNSPFCNNNASCGFGSFCISGRCVRHDDPFDNKCSSDAQCGGTFGNHGRCYLGRCQ